MKRAGNKTAVFNGRPLLALWKRQEKGEYWYRNFGFRCRTCQERATAQGVIIKAAGI